jgi:sarcosine oxidase
VLGIERFGISHANGSHHGHTRITRLAYMEGPEYVPLLRKSFQAYTALERETKQQLFWQTGVLNIGRDVFEAARATAVDQALPHEVLSGSQAQQRFPGGLRCC